MPYTRRTITKGIAEALIAEHGGASKAARAIIAQCQNGAGQRPSIHAVRQWLNDAITEMKVAQAQAIYDPAEADKLNQIKNLLDEANIPIDAIGRISTVKIRSGFHEGLTKDANDEPVVTRLRSKNATIVLSPKWEEGPAWPVVQPAPPTIVKYTAPTVIVPRGLRTEIIYPDTQFGYQRNLETVTFDGKTETCELEPIHAEDSIDVALQLTAAIRPDGLTHIGDLLDNTELSRYLQTAEFTNTTQKGLDRAKRFLDEAKSAAGPSNRRRGQKKAPPKQFRLVDGNHDNRRLGVYVQQNARAAYGLRRADTTPSSWSVVSTPYLLRLDEIGWEFCGTWPHSEAWLVRGQNGLVVVHDPRHRGTYEASVIAGHTHHRRSQSFTVRTPYDSFREFMLDEIGCLCNRGPVTSKSALNRSRTPSDKAFARDWVHGIAVVEILEDTGQHQVDFVQIQDGSAVYRGQQFRSKAAL